MECAGMVGLDLNQFPDEMLLGGDYANLNAEEGDALLCT
jgi:hypothetical protein